MFFFIFNFRHLNYTNRDFFSDIIKRIRFKNAFYNCTVIFVEV